MQQALGDQQKNLKKQIGLQEKKVKDSTADKKRVGQMESILQEKRDAFDQASQSASKIESRVQKVHKKIMELTEGKMNKAREKLDAVTTQITKVTH